jgi:opacity protein-like surface antigen
MVHLAVSRTLSVRIDFSYSHFWADDVVPAANADADVIGLSANALVALRPRSTVSPYLLAGLGSQTSSQDCPGTKTSATLNGGAGIRIRRVLLEARVHLGATGCNSVYHVPITIALSL